MFKYSKITNPTFVVDCRKVRRNIEKMLYGLPQECEFRPHFKTHNNSITAQIFKEYNVRKITVSSVEMGMYFKKLGFRDITVAFPVNIREHKNLNRLSKNIQLALCFANFEAIKQVSGFNHVEADAWIEINTGHNRSGISADDIEQISKMIDVINNSKNLRFKGFLSHAGETYWATSKNEIISISQKARKKLLELKKIFSAYSPLISIGDTPSCVLNRDFSDIDEIRPGNFVYFDLFMLYKEVCKESDIAATVFCPIVDIRKERNELIIHGGSVHFGTEYLYLNGKKVYGKIIHHISNNNSKKIEGYLVSLSQEHGKVSVENFLNGDFRVGDILEIIPVHSCLTANYMKSKTYHINY